MRIRCLASVVAAAVVAGCGSHTDSSTSTTARANVGRLYQLYTHCGIKWAKIEGTFWHARHPLSDGSGNPPDGWANPYQQGRLALIGPTTARFDSPAGTVTFERTSRRRPPRICS
jgi:hypothetical protein